MFQYGALSGDHVFVQELAKFLSKRYQDPVDRYSVALGGKGSEPFFLLVTKIGLRNSTKSLQ